LRIFFKEPKMKRSPRKRSKFGKRFFSKVSKKATTWESCLPNLTSGSILKLRPGAFLTSNCKNMKQKKWWKNCDKQKRANSENRQVFVF
jgi:hypothetical protein